MDTIKIIPDYTWLRFAICFAFARRNVLTIVIFSDTIILEREVNNMIYFEVHMIEHDKWFKKHDKDIKRFKTLKEASLYASKMRRDYWKVDIVRIDTKNELDFRIYGEVSKGKYKRII